MTFHEAMNRAFYSMQEDRQLREPLENSEAYREAAESLKAMLSGVVDRQAAADIKNIFRRLCDLETNYFYRVGIQDGVSLAAEDFPAHGIA